MRYGDFRMMCASWWAGIFGQTRISRVGEGEITTDVVQMADPDVIELTRLEGFGDVVVPLPDSNCIIWRKSDGGVVQSLAVPNLRPTDCKAGDRALYCGQMGTVVKLHGANSSTAGAIELKKNDGSSVVVTSGGDVVLTDKTGHRATMSNGVLTVEDTVTAQHFAGRGAAPTILPGVALGAGGTATVASGSTDTAMRVDFQAGAMGTSIGEICTLTFARRFDAAPHPACAPLDDIAAGATLGGKVYFEVTQSLTQTQMKVLVSAPPPANAAFALSILVVQ